ncbi:Tannase/feruloyl esterase [Bombardia bombarda]|uniref:Carboxylic ester hydrolase n=1 Tax=Bombardia bombarda TaxID=252184 RepID=A0AA40BW01_9PEZI|nr:Tannase/feruloyl esterase [Bombardia bombarda]
MAISLAEACVSSTFSGVSFFGGEILAIDTNLVTKFSASVNEAFRMSQPSVELKDATFCNVTVTYTHPGQNDDIKVETWLPVDNWNGRLQATGGGGWSAGRFFLSYEAMKGAIADGYATVTTDAGLGWESVPKDWALLSPGNLNIFNIQNLGTVSLGDQSLIGKAAVKAFYGKGPEYSYFSGCSQGGRQAMSVAQRYPDAYDGIFAGAPAIEWPQLFGAANWPQQYMEMTGQFPYGCELDAIEDAAIAACDGLDGLVDGIITELDACLETFDPFKEVGKKIDCAEAKGKIKITKAAAAVTNATWHGWRTVDGREKYYGMTPGTDLTGHQNNMLPVAVAVAMTNCTVGTCRGQKIDALSMNAWWTHFIARDPEFDTTSFTHAEFDELLRISIEMYKGFLSANDPDLTGFRNAGGKLISAHGLWDGIIPSKATEAYYNAVAAELPDVDSFYRHYQIPGLGHCWGRQSGSPTSAFEQLRAWVENGTAPEHMPIKVMDKEGALTQERILCPFPQKAAFDKKCGDSGAEKCWSCVGKAKGGSKKTLHDEI